jgi:hypothetical protein
MRGISGLNCRSRIKLSAKWGYHSTFIVPPSRVQDVQFLHTLINIYCVLSSYCVCVNYCLIAVLICREEVLLLSLYNEETEAQRR